MLALGLQSKRETTRTRIRVRTAMAAQTREQGRYLGGRPPYGYRLAGVASYPNKAHAPSAAVAAVGSAQGHHYIQVRSLLGWALMCSDSAVAGHEGGMSAWGRHPLVGGEGCEQVRRGCMPVRGTPASRRASRATVIPRRKIDASHAAQQLPAPAINPDERSGT
jgi:hypothetical protein